MLYELRRHFSLRSRRHQPASKHVTLISEHGDQFKAEFDYASAPKLIAIRTFEERAGIILNRPLDCKYEDPSWKFVLTDGSILAARNAGAPTIEEEVSVTPNFERMLLKIAWCALVGRLGIKQIEPICLDVMLGKKTGIPRYLGGARQCDLVNRSLDDAIVYHQYSCSDGTFLLTVSMRLAGGALELSPIYEAAVAKSLKPMAEFPQICW